ncbi:unnamed protein product [Arctogadus glacialis]
MLEEAGGEGQRESPVPAGVLGRCVSQSLLRRSFKGARLFFSFGPRVRLFFWRELRLCSIQIVKRAGAPPEVVEGFAETFPEHDSDCEEGWSPPGGCGGVCGDISRARQRNQRPQDLRQPCRPRWETMQSFVPGLQHQQSQVFQEHESQEVCDQIVKRAGAPPEVVEGFAETFPEHDSGGL